MIQGNPGTFVLAEAATRILPETSWILPWLDS
jgi:hypothetical protein